MAQKKLKRVEFIVVHCADTPSDMDIGAKEIDKWHRERGFFKIGYHAVIRRDGRVEWGRAINEVGAHAYGVNQKSVGICLVGGRDPDTKEINDHYTPQQWCALEYVVKLYLHTYADAKVIGHNDVSKEKTCPNFDAKAWWASIQ